MPNNSLYPSLYPPLFQLCSTLAPYLLCILSVCRWAFPCSSAFHMRPAWLNHVQIRAIPWPEQSGNFMKAKNRMLIFACMWRSFVFLNNCMRAVLYTLKIKRNQLGFKDNLWISPPINTPLPFVRTRAPFSAFIFHFGVGPGTFRLIRSLSILWLSSHSSLNAGFSSLLSLSICFWSAFEQLSALVPSLVSKYNKVPSYHMKNNPKTWILRHRATADEQQLNHICPPLSAKLEHLPVDGQGKRMFHLFKWLFPIF